MRFAGIVAIVWFGCTMFPQRAPEVSPAGSWYTPPTHHPGICMTFEPSGTLLFRGGFEFYNPSTWEHDRREEAVFVVLGGSWPFPTSPLQFQLEHAPATLRRIDASRRLLVFPFRSDTRVLQFQTFNFTSGPCEGPA